MNIKMRRWLCLRRIFLSRYFVAAKGKEYNLKGTMRSRN
jgi:hypothetical protein